MSQVGLLIMQRLHNYCTVKRTRLNESMNQAEEVKDVYSPLLDPLRIISRLLADNVSPQL